MDRADYIRQVDAMALPDSLRQRLGTLPTKGKNGPARAPGTTSRGGHHSISRWAGIAAALVLVVGLGVAAPYLFPTLFTGGELTPPPVATNPSVPNPEGIIAEGLEVSDVLLDAAKEYVRAQYDYWTELHGARPGVPTPAVYDNWRIEGITAVYERKQLGAYTVAVFRLDYRIHTTTPEITRNYLVGGMDLDDEGWLQPVAPGSTYLVFPLNYSTPHSFGMVTDGVSPGTEQFDRDLLAALEREFSPAISDEELTELLAAEFPETTENDTYSLLYSATQRGRTMGALLYRGGGHYVLGTIIVGVFDNETKAPVREIQIHTGDLGEAVGVVGREQVVYLLWTNCMGRGVDWVAGLYTFSHGELTAVTELPPYTVEGTLPDGALTMLDPERSADFWADHKAVINGVGLDLYNRNPEYHYIRNNEVEEWLFACSIQFQFSTGPDVAKEPPELRTEGDALFIRYPGETAWEEVLPMLPMPAQRHAPAIDGLTSMTEFPRDNLYFGFTSPTEGWLALGGNNVAWLPYNYIYLTHDGGHTWVEATGDLNDQCTMFLNCAVFSDESHGFLGYRYEWGGNAPLYWTEDGGKSWKPYDMNILPLPGNDNIIYEPTDITFDGSEGTFAFTRHTRDDQGQPIETKLTVALTDYGTGIQFDTVPVFEEQLSPYSIKSSQLPYGDPNAAWMGGYETQPLRPLARLPEAGIDLYGLNKNWCGTGGVLLVRDRDMSTAVWYLLPYDRAIGGCSLALSDYDGDGQDELAMVLSMSSGTGVAEYNLYMVELEGRGFRFCAIFDESSHPLILEALGELGGSEYDQFGQWQIYSLEDSAIHMELGVHGKDIPPYVWQGMLTADVCWDGETETFSLKNAQFSKNE